MDNRGEGLKLIGSTINLFPMTDEENGYITRWPGSRMGIEVREQTCIQNALGDESWIIEEKV